MGQLALFQDAGAPRRWADLSDCLAFRWLLGRSWGEGPRIAWVMLNPSTADATVDDPTLKRVTAFSRRWGYGSLVVVNQHPFRSPHPSALAAWLAAGVGVPAAAAANAERVAEALSGAQAVVAAWGAGGDPDLGRTLLAGRPAICLGRTASGAPLHPLARGRMRVPDDAEPMPFAA